MVLCTSYTCTYDEVDSLYICRKSWRKILIYTNAVYAYYSEIAVSIGFRHESTENINAMWVSGEKKCLTIPTSTI